MRTRIHTWIDKKRWIPMYGVQVHAQGCWRHVAVDGVAQLFDTKQEAENLRADMRQRPSNLDRRLESKHG